MTFKKSTVCGTPGFKAVISIVISSDAPSVSPWHADKVLVHIWTITQPDLQIRVCYPPRMSMIAFVHSSKDLYFPFGAFWSDEHATFIGSSAAARAVTPRYFTFTLYFIGATPWVPFCCMLVLIPSWWHIFLSCGFISDFKWLLSEQWHWEAFLFQGKSLCSQQFRCFMMSKSL